MSLSFVTVKQNNVYTTTAFLNNKDAVCECKISADTSRWVISSWFTMDGYKHNGYGSLTLKACVKEILQNKIYPNTIEYVWNGKNKYVLDWLITHFHAVCNCPVAVRKYATDDDWESYIYTLDQSEFMKYCTNI